MNAFEVLGLPTRPLPDPEEVKAAHLRAMASCHPDSVGSHEEALQLNRAREILDSDRLRILHLLEVTGGKPAPSHGSVPPALGDLFAELAGLLNRARSHLQAAGRADSALEKAALLPEGLDLFDALRNFQVRIRALRTEQVEALQSCDAAWLAGARDLAGLERIALALAFIDRWSEQVDEHCFRLSGILT